jgi:hypothetical protein
MNMRLLGNMIVTTACILLPVACTKQNSQKKPTEKDSQSSTGNGHTSTSQTGLGGASASPSAPWSSGNPSNQPSAPGVQGNGQSQPSGAPSADNARLINNWSGTEDIHPTGLKFNTRSFQEAPSPNTPSQSPTPSATGTFTLLIAEFRLQGCLACHAAGASQAARPLDSHAGMVLNGQPQAWVLRAPDTIRSDGGAGKPKLMPPQNVLQPSVRTANAAKIDQLIQAWAVAKYPAQ